MQLHQALTNKVRVFAKRYNTQRVNQKLNFKDLHIALVETGTGKKASWHFALLVYNGDEALISSEESSSSGNPRKLLDISIDHEYVYAHFLPFSHNNNAS